MYRLVTVVYVCISSSCGHNVVLSMQCVMLVILSTFKPEEIITITVTLGPLVGE